ncbi:MAG TPA: flavodoxin family protein [Spirochaetota bacterium]|nr:flavodoxin family protein [Spirochaetota bacterium]HPN14010.1 flavodoxin family protein [Spirochaetota bacterium]
MRVLGIYGSPRAGGNTDLLLDRVLEGAASAGAEVARIYVRDMSFDGCIECGGCDKTGSCVVRDDMQPVYRQLLDARVVFLASPVFFYGLTAQVKALIDRCQALWNLRRLTKKTAEERKLHGGGCGFLVMAGAAGGLNLYTGSELTAKYFFDALDKSYGGGAFFRADAPGDVLSNPDDMKRAFGFGKEAVQSCQ